MVCLKLFILSIIGFIWLTHGPVHVSGLIFPPPARLGPELEPAPSRRSDERLTFILVEDNILQDGGEFDSDLAVALLENLD